MAKTTIFPMIDGKRWKMYTIVGTKEKARTHKATLKNRGYLVRIRPAYGNYMVFYRGKQGTRA